MAVKVPTVPRMDDAYDSALDKLWGEYSIVFRDFDDLSLARWMAQTLGHLEGRAWRFSHPLLGAYRIAAQIAHDRQIWLKRLANAPAAYPQADCCRAPLMPLLTRDVAESGLLCQHCSGVAIPFDDIPEPYRSKLRNWTKDYEPVHEVAHWEDHQRLVKPDCDRAFEEAAQGAERLLGYAGSTLAPQLLEFYPAIVWEDQDECLEVRPEDINL
ncbi:MAG: hypothetical protein ACI9VS_002724 [Candidatus Binatia bacterium]|jgi:hypothetical protein